MPTNSKKRSYEERNIMNKYQKEDFRYNNEECDMSDGQDETIDSTHASDLSRISQFIVPRKRIRLNLRA